MPEKLFFFNELTFEPKTNENIQLAIPRSFPSGLHAVNHSETRWKYGGGHVKKSKGAPKMHQPEQRGLLVTMLSQRRGSGGRK